VAIKAEVYVWQHYWGELLHNDSEQTRLYGFENESAEFIKHQQATITGAGTCFGFVAKGEVACKNDEIHWVIKQDQWFCIPALFDMQLNPETRVVILQALNFQGLYSMGGPIETHGRLRYIDGCSDTLLCAPPLLGDPCLNLLHFPPGIQQTQHTHPSLRAGIIAKGLGLCVTKQAEIPLSAGMLFYLPKETEHGFITTTEAMDVIAYHPDSDWGPTHQQHPMVNRTWVDGHKIDNVGERHQSAEIIQGRS